MFRILVVEDDVSLKNLFCRTLQRNNYQTFGADRAEMPWNS